jgi:transcriptional regulator
MYVPAHFEETRLDVIHGLIAAHELGTLVTLSSDGLNANHIPFEIDPTAGPFGTLRAHVARSNPVWRDIQEGAEPLVIFQGAQAYISPSWYPSKADDPRVVPTYNYMVVHAYGSMRVIDDPVWLRGLVARLTQRHEASMAQPWRIADAPEDYIEKMLAAIIGIEIPIARLLGKWKVSQNQPEQNRAGVADALRRQGGEQASMMAGQVRR